MPRSHDPLVRAQGQLMETVPLPANRAEVTHPCTRDFLTDPPTAATTVENEGCTAAAGNADTENEMPRAQVVLDSPGDAVVPRVRGWLQREVEMGMREAPVPQLPA